MRVCIPTSTIFLIDPEIMIFKNCNDYEKMCKLPSRKQVTLKGRKIEIISIRLNAPEE